MAAVHAARAAVQSRARTAVSTVLYALEIVDQTWLTSLLRSKPTRVDEYAVGTPAVTTRAFPSSHGAHRYLESLPTMAPTSAHVIDKHAYVDSTALATATYPSFTCGLPVTTVSMLARIVAAAELEHAAIRGSTARVNAQPSQTSTNPSSPPTRPCTTGSTSYASRIMPWSTGTYMSPTIPSTVDRSSQHDDPRVVASDCAFLKAARRRTLTLLLPAADAVVHVLNWGHRFSPRAMGPFSEANRAHAVSTYCGASAEPSAHLRTAV